MSNLSAAKKRTLHALLFYPVLVVAGLCNLYGVAGSPIHRFVFPLFVAGLTVYFAYLLKISTLRQRMLFLVGMFVCAFGENLLVYGLDLYHFSPTREAPYAIPPYVIMGHGYAVWTALVLGEEAGGRLGPRRAFVLVGAASLVLFLVRLGLHSDLYGGVWIVFYLLALLSTRRWEDRLLYAVTFVLTTFLELCGVALRAWDWHPASWYLPSPAYPICNPPSAVGSFYVIGDLLSLVIVRSLGLASPGVMPEEDGASPRGTRQE